MKAMGKLSWRPFLATVSGASAIALAGRTPLFRPRGRHRLQAAWTSSNAERTSGF